jgi:hypothetical protein
VPRRQAVRPRPDCASRAILAALAGAGSADRGGDRGEVPGIAVAGGAGPRPAGRVAGLTGTVHGRVQDAGPTRLVPVDQYGAFRVLLLTGASYLGTRPGPDQAKASDPQSRGAERPDRHHPDLDRRRARPDPERRIARTCSQQPCRVDGGAVAGRSRGAGAIVPCYLKEAG